MKLTERTKRITGSIIIALLMVGGSYVLSGPSLPWSKTVDAESAEALLAAYAAKDTDSDGLPDWQESLYGTDPANAYSNGNPEITDGEAARQGLLKPNGLAAQLPQEPETTAFNVDEIPGVDPAPGSITERFSTTFMQRFVAASGGVPMDEATRQQLTQEMLQQFTSASASILASRYTEIAVRTDASVALTTYAGEIEDILRTNDVAEGEAQPTALANTYIVLGDESAREKLERLSAVYRSITQDLLLVRVPPSQVNNHLALIRSFDSLARSTAIVTEYEKDPLAAVGAISLFGSSSRDLLSAIDRIGVALLSIGEPAAGQPGALLVQIARSAQSASTQ